MYVTNGLIVQKIVQFHLIFFQGRSGHHSGGNPFWRRTAFTGSSVPASYKQTPNFAWCADHHRSPSARAAAALSP